MTCASKFVCRRVLRTLVQDSSALRKKLTRRARPDHSQVLRRTIQLAFLFLNVWLGLAFYFWVRRMETGAPGRIVVRPAGVEGWLPIAGLMNLKYWLTTGRVPASHPAALFVLVSFLAIAFLFRKGVLQLAVSGWDFFRISLACGPAPVNGTVTCPTTFIAK